MAIWVSSDWHCDPGGLKQAVMEWINRGKAGGHRLIGDGDLFDILLLGRMLFQNAASVEQLATLLDGYPFDYVAGNHDPYNIVRKIMASYTNITMHRQLRIEENGRRYFLTHGHRWAVDWGFLRLRHIAPRLVETMVNVASGPWYWLCRRVGWLASRPAAGAPAGKELQRINKLIRVIWAGASHHALKQDCCVILGHTHAAGSRQRGISKEAGFLAYMVDDGDLPEGTFVEITGDAVMKFL